MINCSFYRSSMHFTLAAKIALIVSFTRNFMVTVTYHDSGQHLFRNSLIRSLGCPFPSFLGPEYSFRVYQYAKWKTNLESRKTMKTNLKPWKTTETMKNHWNHEKPLKPWKIMKTDLSPWKNNREPWKTIKKTPGTMKNYVKPTWNQENSPRTMKSQPKTLKTDLDPCKTTLFKDFCISGTLFLHLWNVIN